MELNLPHIPSGRCEKSKVLVLAPGNNAHTVKWANGLNSRNFNVGLVSLHGFASEIHQDVQRFTPPQSAPWGYQSNRSWLDKVVADFQPDLVHGHYGTGYGHLGADISGRPKVLSLWGTEVYQFAHKSPLHRWFLRKNLRAYDWICSTSKDMARKTLALEPLNHKLSITPFGVDVKSSPPVSEKPETQNASVRVGTTKSHSEAYGLDVLLKGFAHARETLPSLRLLLVGEGPQSSTLKLLSQSLGLADAVEFRGAVPPTQILKVLGEMDIYVAPSRRESFGVAVLEASAAGLPVIASDVGGLPEVVRDGETGFLVPPTDARALGDKIILLARDASLRNEMGHRGRSFVSENYLWQDSLDIMESLYAHLLKGETPVRP